MRSPVAFVLALFAAPAAVLAQTPPETSPPVAPQPAAPDSANLPAATTAAGAAQEMPETPRPRADAGAVASVEPTSSARPTPAPAPPDLVDRIAQSVVLHGYLRTRSELFHNFAIGWDDPAWVSQYNNAQWPWVRNPDNGLSALCSTDPAPGSTMRVPGNCSNNTQTSANMRLRLNPEIHITDNIAVYAQIDMLDNLVLGSTPQGYYTGGTPSPWAPFTAFSTTQVTPAPQNSLTPSITVSRAWAEVTNPSLGQIRFGRMPSHWGLGILANAGNGIDSDYQSHSDRLMYAARVRSLGLFLAAIWDFASTGSTSAAIYNEPGQGQPYDISQLDDVRQWIFAVGRRVDPEEARQRLARGDVVWNGGLYNVYRMQILSDEFAGTNPGADQRTVGTAGGGADTTSLQNQFLRRDAHAYIGDAWFQLLHRSFRFELEAAFIVGSLSLARNPPGGTQSYDIRQFGGAMQFDYRLMNNRLQLEFHSGYATGDADLEGITYQNGLSGTRRASDSTLSLFRFHPDYRIDLILWRQVMKQISGAYYFRPGVQYSFVREPGGNHFFGAAHVIWSRASEFVETRGNHADLGIEIDAELTYQSNWRDVTLGDRPAPGFFASLQYGVLFPMAGLGPRDNERVTGNPLVNFSFSTAQTLRGIVGVLF